jgi:phytoene dehydrogenase-like protein
VVAVNSTEYDSVVIGAGHNGLVCAAYLARSGQRVLVLEASSDVGGLAAQREFHPGFRVSVPHTVNHFSRKVVRDLELEKHGFGTSPQTPGITGLSQDGRRVSVAGKSLEGAAASDQEAYGDYQRLMNRFAETLDPFWQKTIPRIGDNSMGELATFAHLGLNLRMLGKEDMREFLRLAALPTRDLMDEYFSDDVLKVILSWDGLVGGKLAPRSPNNSVITMLYRMSGNHGGPGLVRALRSSAEAAGVELRTDSPVSSIRIDSDSDGQRANGVQLASGETIIARSIVSSADPTTTFLDLIGVDHLEIGFTNRIRRLRNQGYVGKLHLALSELPGFEGVEHPQGRMILADTLDSIEFAFDDAKYGHGSEYPVMEVVIPSFEDPSLAPDGQHVLSAHVMYVPRAPKDGDNDALRRTMTERSIDVLERYAPGIRDIIIHQEFLTPGDIEQRFGTRGGHWHHGELSADQMLMMRPTYEAAQYRTPIPGLYLCGAGSHPGGDLTGYPGHNAAREILR